ncbi:MAG: ABC transporter ATP-binding protein/permease [Clostridia bacterium]|nr:ABC transporter ATP-binding protein/permease [Clostridia bacterium]
MSKKKGHKNGPSDISYWFRKEWRTVLLTTLGGIIYNLGLGAGPWFEGQLAGRFADILDGRAAPSVMIKTAAAYFAVIIVVQAARAVKRLYVRKFANNTGLRMKRMIFRSMLNGGAGAAGDEITKAVNDVEACAEGMRKALTEIFDTGLALIVYVGMLFRYDPLLALICTGFSPLAMLCAERMKKTVQTRTAEAKESASALNSAVVDRVNNAVTYRAYGVEDVRREMLEKNFSDFEKKSIMSNVWETAMTPVYKVISTAGVIFAIWMGGRNVAGIGTAVWDIAAFTTFISLFLRLSTKASKTAKLFKSVQKAGVSWRRIKPRLSESADAELPIPEKSGVLSVKGLSFAYPGKEPMFRNIEFTAKPGDIIGITGEIASGKTALGRCFICECDYTGSIEFGGVSLRDRIADKKHITVAYMGHSPELFDGSIEDNIRLGDDTDERGERLEKVLETVRLSDEIEGFSEGVRSRVGNGGIMLSGGQQARVALARVLYSGAPLLVLDDPFSATDMKTEREIMDGLKRMAPDSVILLISHRLAVFPELDGVIFLPGDGSACVSDHRTLLETNELYRRLYSLQCGTEEVSHE